MMQEKALLLLEAEAAKARRQSPVVNPFDKYRNDPVLYAADFLKNADGSPVRWWDKQQEIALALLEHRRVFVKASHSIGKSHVAGGLVNWFYDCHNPGIVLTTATTKSQVEDVLWKEVRIQRAGRPGLMPKAPRMESSPDHFAVGYTATDASSFQGRHEKHVLIIFDEATGIDGAFWDAAEGMITGETCYFLAILNPTDTASRAYQEEKSGNWHVITVSALDHPNIAADIAGQPVPFPSAVRKSFIDSHLHDWCDRIRAEDARADDIEFPPNSGNWYKPGALFEGRILGRWSTQAGKAIWSESMWNACLIETPLQDEPTQIGCDVARYGDDYTSMVVRRGNCCLHHETHNGWNTAQTAGRLKMLCREWAAPGEEPTRIAIKVDEPGVGAGVIDQKEEYNFVPMNPSCTPREPEKYRNVRSELWFTAQERANEGRIDVSRLTPSSRKLLQTQLMAPIWKPDSQGRLVVEEKEDTKKVLKRSPDDADAFNLAFAPAGGDWKQALAVIKAYSPPPRISRSWE